MRIARHVILVTAIAAVAMPVLAEDVTLDASALALRSSGVVSGSDVTLNQNGYLGTYVTLAAPGVVNFSVNASGVADGGTVPRMNVVVDDFKKSFDVAAGANAYNGSVTLPAGTHFVRLEYDDDSATTPARALSLKNLTVSGATFANADTSANALDAANTYIANYRRGDVHIALTGPGGVPLLEGTKVHAKMARNAFNFGGTVSGATIDDAKDMLGAGNPSPTSEAGKFQAFVKKNFNTIVPSNGGKWAYTEPTRGAPNMALPDQQLNWAIANNKRARMHTLIWGTGTSGGNQEPAWVKTLISQAAAGSAQAKADLRAAISDRIKYYAGTLGSRSQKYIEVDGLNESLHNPAYTNIFGVAGVADIYTELDAAIKAAGGQARTYLNEWNVLQFSPATVNASGAGTGSDPYANYYRAHIDAVRDAGGPVSGIGIQYYANYTQTGGNAHSAATIQKALGNLSVTGLSISMDEFGGASSMTKANSAAGAAVLEDSLRMFYGNANATTFMIWGWWDLSSGAYPPAALLDNSQGNAVLTPMGQKWEQMMALWSTDVTSAVDVNGTLSFNGYWGDYNINDVAAFSNLTLSKGTDRHTLQLASPPGWSLSNPDATDAQWTSASTWSAGGVPNGVGITAHFSRTTDAKIIALDSAITLGQMNFDGTGGYSIASSVAGAITLQTLVGGAAMNVIAGDHTIEVPLSLANDVHVVIRDLDSELRLSHLLDAPDRSLTKRGDGTLAVDHVRLRSFSIEAGRVKLLRTSANPRLNRVGKVSIASGASLDVADSIWTVDDATQAPAIRSLIEAGAITSSLLDQRHAIGFAPADQVALSIVGDAQLSTDAIVFRLTLNGDTNLDGHVNFQDLVTLARHYNAIGGQVWNDGDFDGDGKVNFTDLVALAQNYNSQGVASLPMNGLSHAFANDWLLAQSLAPEPAALFGALSMGAVSSTRARR